MGDMSQVEFEAIKATFPWTERTLCTNIGVLVQVIDRNGSEVSLFTMARFLEVITRKLAAKQSEEKKKAA